MDLAPDNVVGSLSLARATNTYGAFERIHKHGHPIAFPGHYDVHKYSEISAKYLNSGVYASDIRELVILNTIIDKK